MSAHGEEVGGSRLEENGHACGVQDAEAQGSTMGNGR
jgi:hypothetical protein